MIYSDKCQLLLQKEVGIFSVLDPVEHCLDPPFRMGALTAAAAGSTNCSGCWEYDGRLLTAEYPFSGDYAGVERAIFFNVLPPPASKDWFTQKTVV